MLSILTRALMTAGSPKALEYIGYSPSSSSVANSQLVISKPAGAKAGDVLVACGIVAGNNNWNTLAGWTYHKNTTSGVRNFAASKVVTGSEGSSFTFTAAGSDRATGMMLLLRPTGLFEVVGSEASATLNGNISAPSVNAKRGMLLMVAAGAVLSTRDFSVPAGMTAVGPTVGNQTSRMRVFYEQNSPGATGVRTSTMSGGSGTSIAYLLNFKA